MSNRDQGFIASLWSHSTLRNLSYLMGAEGLSRVFRVCTTILMAQALSISQFGLLAIALTVFELISVLANNGFGLFLLKQGDRRLLSAANTVYVLSWLWAGLMCALQLLVALVLDNIGQSQASLIVQAMAPFHLLTPLALTHVYLIHRGGELGSFAGVATVQNISDCLLTMLFLAGGFGVWSIVFARLLSILVWVVGFRVSRSWQLDLRQGFVAPHLVFAYTGAVLVSEYAKSFRTWGDNLIVGSALGADVLGIYYFAKNSGLGISLSISQVCVTTLTPRFAQLLREEEPVRIAARKRLLAMLGGFFSVVVGSQVLFAPWYVPLLFGETWVPAVPVLTLLCLSAIPRGLGELYACLARTSGLSNVEMRWNSWYSLFFLAVVLAGVQLGLEWLCALLILLNVLMAFAIALGTRSLLEPVKTNSAVEGLSA